MTDIAAPGPLPPPPPRSGHGCLWGCLIAGLIAIVAVVGAFSYLGWYFNIDEFWLLSFGRRSVAAGICRI